MPHRRVGFVALFTLGLVVGCAPMAMTAALPAPPASEPPAGPSAAQPQGRLLDLDVGDGADPEPQPVVPFWPAPDPFEGFQPDAFPDPLGRDLGPAAAVGRPADPEPEPAPASWTAGPPVTTGNEILERAQAMLGIKYLWGGNTLTGLDCSAYVSRAWGISRQITDTLYRYSTEITKDELLPGDAMNLTKGQDPRGYGHVRLFAAWANDEHTRVWVYEETPRQSLFHVIAYDARYTPIRLRNFSSDLTEAPVVPAPAAKPKAPAARGLVAVAQQRRPHAPTAVAGADASPASTVPGVPSTPSSDRWIAAALGSDAGRQDREAAARALAEARAQARAEREAAAQAAAEAWAQTRAERAAAEKAAAEVKAQERAAAAEAKAKERAAVAEAKATARAERAAAEKAAAEAKAKERATVAEAKATARAERAAAEKAAAEVKARARTAAAEAKATARAERAAAAEARANERAERQAAQQAHGKRR